MQKTLKIGKITQALAVLRQWVAFSSQTAEKFRRFYVHCQELFF